MIEIELCGMRTKTLFFVSSTQNQEKIFKRKLRHEKLNHESRNCFTINYFTLYRCGWTACDCITFQSWRKPLISTTDSSESFTLKLGYEDRVSLSKSELKLLPKPYEKRTFQSLVSSHLPKNLLFG